MHQHPRGQARFWFAAALIVGSFAARADAPKTPTTHIYATDWGLTLRADGSGFYNDLAKLVLADEAGAVKYEILPYRRATRRFVADTDTCLYPNSLGFMAKSGIIETTDGYMEGHPVIRARMHIFSRPGEPAVHTTQDLKGKTVAYPLGASTPTLLKGHGAIFVPVSDEEDKARLLLGNRVDLIVAALPDALFVFKHLKSQLPPYAPDFSFNASALSVACHATDANARFLEHLNRRIESLIQSGTLERFIRAQGLDPAAYLPAIQPMETPRTP